MRREEMKTYLKHFVKTQIPAEFIEIGLEDYSWKNDAVGCMGHPLIENYSVYPVANYSEALENTEFPEIPEAWFLFNPNCPEDSAENMTVDEIVQFFKKTLEEMK